MRQLAPSELADWLADSARTRPCLIDVREPWEHEHCHIEGSVLVPMNTVPGRLGEFDGDAPMVVICHHGARSFQVACFLEQNGFRQLYNLAGGVDAWARTVDSAMPTY